MEPGTFEFAHPDDVAVRATIHWSTPYAHEVLLTGNADEDEGTYFYAIVAYTDREWWTYYIGMSYDQWVSDRHKQPDHVEKLKELRRNNKETNFQVSLGAVKFAPYTRVTRALIEELEGLLIYANWHEDLVNKKKTEGFHSKRSFHVENAGFVDHLETAEIAYGVVYRKG